MSRPSKRFSPSKWAGWLVPAVLILLLLALFGTILLVILYSFGLVSLP